MKYNVISYLIGEGFRNIFKNKKSTFSALTTMCLCMLVFGIFFIISENINNIMTTIEDAQGMKVFFKPDVDEEKIQTYGSLIEQIEGINQVKYESKEYALNTLKEDYQGVLDGLEFNQMEAAYKVTLSDLSKNEEIQEKITNIVGDDLSEITSSNQAISTLLGISKGVRIFTLGLLIILVTIALVIIGNTIKLTVHARRKEISIMKYVGATNSFIRWPFIVEGIIIGVVAALITIVIIGFVYNALVPKLLENDIIKELEISFVAFSDMFNLMMFVNLALGIGIGVLGSVRSMKKYLEV